MVVVRTATECDADLACTPRCRQKIDWRDAYGRWVVGCWHGPFFRNLSAMRRVGVPVASCLVATMEIMARDHGVGGADACRSRASRSNGRQGGSQRRSGAVLDRRCDPVW